MSRERSNSLVNLAAQHQQGLLVVGPDITLAAAKEREGLAREDKRVKALRQEHACAAALEARHS